jgi:hypothetical protein
VSARPAKTGTGFLQSLVAKDEKSQAKANSIWSNMNEEQDKAKSIYEENLSGRYERRNRSVSAVGGTGRGF